jgi:hypothetical protein
MKPVLLAALLLFPISAMAQVSCFDYGGYAGTISCDGSNLSNRTLVPLGPDRSRGIITDEKGNVDPYMTLSPRDRDYLREQEQRSRSYYEDRHPSSRSGYGSRSGSPYDDWGR